MKSLTWTSLAGLASLLSVSVAQNQGNSANCTVFTWNQQPGYLINGTSRRISAAATCPSKQNETHDCPISASGVDVQEFTYNISNIIRDAYWNSDDGSQSFLYNLISPAVNSSLNGQGWISTTSGAIDTIQPLSPDTSGYISFTPFLRCFEGVMSNCTGGVQDGVAIQACCGVYHVIGGNGRNAAALDGNYSIIEVPQADVSNYRDPFQGQVSNDANVIVHRKPATVLAVALVVGATAFMF